MKDTEALVSSLQIPQVYSEVVCGQIRAIITIDSNGVDVVGVCVAEDATRHGLYGDVILDFDRHT